jgi:acetoacetyl-CoA synthetase
MAVPAAVSEGDLLWSPSPEWIAGCNLTHYMRWLARERGLRFDDYRSLWTWSTTDIEAFWQSIWDYAGIRASVPPSEVLRGGRRDMPGADWFPGARLNYAEHVLAQERPGTDALLYLSEDTPLRGYAWEQLAAEVRILATELRRRGVGPGDRVVAYMPNVPQAMVAMLATTSIGAIWAICSPDFGSQGVLDRISQLSPKVLFCTDRYRYSGKDYDRRDELRIIISALPSLELVVEVPRDGTEGEVPLSPLAVAWDALLDAPPVCADDFRFEQVPFGHPLWVLFTSGTTGLPKPIVHGHGGIVLEMNKALRLHHDFRPGERIFFYTTTGWMMWNFLASSLMVGVCPVLYDGNPAHPSPDALWKMVQDSRASFFGASPSYVEIMRKAGIVPRERYDLSSLRSIMPAGSPVSPECTAWFYRNVKEDLWVATGSGGTDCCTGLVGGVPILPVRAGEIQAPSLGVAAASFDEHGRSVINQVGELVITQPMPSMPVAFWGDEDGSRYRASYFEDFPGVWRHGDLFRINERQGCFVLGRSDATLNRHGVRIGTAEIYRALEGIPGVLDGLIVNLDLPGGRFFMPLFVRLADGYDLTPELQRHICERLRSEYSPRHVPDRIFAVSVIPTTLTGKKMEVPVRRILMGAAPEAVANRSAMADPHALDPYVEFARRHGPGYHFG